MGKSKRGINNDQARKRKGERKGGRKGSKEGLIGKKNTWN